MAKNSHQQRKQQLVEALHAKRSAVQYKTSSLKGKITELPKSSKAVATGALKPGMRNVTQSAFRKTPSGVVNTKKGTSSKLTKLPWKQIGLGVGALIITKKVLKKSKKQKLSKKNSGGVGSALFKWGLSLSLPAAKYLVTKKIKKSF